MAFANPFIGVLCLKTVSCMSISAPRLPFSKLSLLATIAHNPSAPSVIDGKFSANFKNFFVSSSLLTLNFKRRMIPRPPAVVGFAHFSVTYTQLMLTYLDSSPPGPTAGGNSSPSPANLSNLRSINPLFFPGAPFRTPFFVGCPGHTFCGTFVNNCLVSCCCCSPPLRATRESRLNFPRSFKEVSNSSKSSSDFSFLFLSPFSSFSSSSLKPLLPSSYVGSGTGPSQTSSFTRCPSSSKSPPPPKVETLINERIDAKSTNKTHTETQTKMCLASCCRLLAVEEEETTPGSVAVKVLLVVVPFSIIVFYISSAQKGSIRCLVV